MCRPCLIHTSRLGASKVLTSLLRMETRIAKTRVLGVKIGLSMDTKKKHSHIEKPCVLGIKIGLYVILGMHICNASKPFAMLEVWLPSIEAIMRSHIMYCCNHTSIHDVKCTLTVSSQYECVISYPFD